MATIIRSSKYFSGYKLISLMTPVMRMKKLNCKIKNLFLIVVLVSKVVTDIDSGKDEQSSVAVSINFLSESDQSVSQNTAGQVNAQNGTVWKNITGAPGLGRAFSSNMFSERPGPTSYCHRSVVNGSPYSAFHLFIDEHMLRCIQKHTINH